MKPKYEFIARARFVETRYVNYQLKKKILDKYDPQRKVSYLTDLDSISPEYQKPLREVILCDRCNEDIQDPHVVLLEDNYVYHQKCIFKEITLGTFKPKNPGAKIIPFPVRDRQTHIRE